MLFKRSAMLMFVVAASATGASGCAGCGGSENAGPDATPPTYTELFDNYFAPGTPGHCATPECHADPNHNIWLCGTTKDTCYQGMLTEGLFNPADPKASLIIDKDRSPLIWINSKSGFMPFDDKAPNAAGRDAIIAWVLGGAKND